MAQLDWDDFDLRQLATLDLTWTGQTPNDQTSFVLVVKIYDHFIKKVAVSALRPSAFDQLILVTKRSQNDKQ